MKPLLVAAAVAFVAVAAAPAAEARPRPFRGKRFEANKTLGLGLELGAPTGVTGKYFVASDRAIDFGLGDIDYYGNRSGLNAYGDYLWHPVSLASTDDFELPLFFGVGARIWDFDDNVAHDSGFAIGARLPAGISFDFNNIPLDVFFQVSFVVDILVGYAPHDLYPALNASIGARYWFE